MYNDSQRFGGFAKSREGSLLPFLGFSKSACCAKSAKRRAQEADVIRRTVVAKGAERISPQHPNIRKFCESANFLINFDYMLYIQCFLYIFGFVFCIEIYRIYCTLFF